MYEVKNVGTAIRIIYDEKRRAKTILPGQTVTMSLSSETYDRLTESSKSVEVSGDRPVVERFDPDRDGRPGGSLPAGDLPEGDTAAALLAAEDVEFPDFTRRAKVILGDEWPGGMPKKRIIVKLLEEKAEAEASQSQEEQ